MPTLQHRAPDHRTTKRTLPVLLEADLIDKVDDNPPAETKPPANTAPKYIPIEDLLEYRKKGLTLQEIATLTGCTKQAVSKRLQSENLDSLANYRDNKDQVFESLQRKALQNIDHASIEKVSIPQRVWIAGVLQDKIMAMRGQASQIIEHRNIIADLRQARQRMVDAGLIVDADEAG